MSLDYCSIIIQGNTHLPSALENVRKKERPGTTGSVWKRMSNAVYKTATNTVVKDI